MSKRHGALAALVTVVALVASACGGASTPSAAKASTSAAAKASASAPAKSSGQATAAKPIVLTVANEAQLTSLDPPAGTGTHTGRTLSGNVYESLVATEGPQGKLTPVLATSWSVAPDGLSYTFHLRHNVKFQDGTPFNADAVKFTFDRDMNPKDPYYYGPYAFPSFFLASYKDVVVVDPYTVRFDLKYVDPTFIDNLVWETFGIVSPTAVKKYGKQFMFHGAGTGPFMIQKWDQGSQLVTKANPNYWGPKPKINYLIFKPIVEEASRLTGLESGAVNVIAALDPQFAPQVQSHSNLKVETSEGIHTWYVLLNTASGPFSKLQVRQAVNYAIDWKSITKNLLKGDAVASDSFSYPGTWSYNPASEIYNYDPAKAKQLLASAGFPNGFSATFLVPSSGSGMIAPVQLANVMQSDLAKVGIKIKIVQLDWDSYLAQVLGKGLDHQQATGGGRADMAEMSWMSTAADPGLYVNYYLMCNSTPGHANGFNQGYFCDPKVSGLLKSAMATVNQSQRAQDYKQAQVLVAKDAPWIFGFHNQDVIAMDKNVQGVTPDANMNYLYFGNAYFGS